MWISPRSYSWKETLLDILRGKQCSELSSEVLSLFSPALNALLAIFRVKHSCLMVASFQYGFQTCRGVLFEIQRHEESAKA